MGVSINGDPQNGLFIMENPIKMDGTRRQLRWPITHLVLVQNSPVSESLSQRNAENVKIQLRSQHPLVEAIMTV